MPKGIGLWPVQGGALALLALLIAGSAAPAPRFGDADDADAVRFGRRIYAANCAGCHGRRLQGQPLWQVVDADTARRAPALDASGHAWLRGDAELRHIVAAGAPSMPAFAASLDAPALLAVVAFIKARWPLALRVAQAARNPGGGGLPQAATDDGWRFPPTCGGAAAGVASGGDTTKG